MKLSLLNLLAGIILLIMYVVIWIDNAPVDRMAVACITLINTVNALQNFMSRRRELKLEKDRRAFQQGLTGGGAYPDAYGSPKPGGRI